MKYCININSPEILRLSTETNLHPAAVAAKVAVWQKTNVIFDRYPTYNELTLNYVESDVNKIKEGSLEDVLSGVVPVDKLESTTQDVLSETPKTTTASKIESKPKAELVPKTENITKPQDVGRRYTLQISYGHKIVSGGKEITLTDQQVDAVNQMLDYIEHPIGRFFVLAGFAGTGKSTIVKAVLEQIEKRLSYKLVSPTHAATKNLALLSKKNDPLIIGTLHGTLGLIPDYAEKDFDPKNPPFAKGGTKTFQRFIEDVDVLFIDEASMINKSLYEFIQETADKYGKIIIFMGDPAQLPPVNEKESPVFDSKNQQVWLTRIMRTQSSNPLLDIFTAIREDLNAIDDNFEKVTRYNPETKEGVIFTNKKDELVEKAVDQFKENYASAKILAWTNKAVKQYNEAVVNKLFDLSKGVLQEGMILTSYVNIKESKDEVERIGFAVTNSSDYRIAKITRKEVSFGKNKVKVFEAELHDTRGDGKTTMHILDHTDPQSLKAYKETMRALKNAAMDPKNTKEQRVMLWKKFYGFKEAVTLLIDTSDVSKSFDYGYATTVHKAQGRTIDHVFIDIDNINDNKNVVERNKMKYTAFTRAAKSATVYTAFSENKSMDDISGIEGLSIEEINNLIKEDDRFNDAELLSIEDIQELDKLFYSPRASKMVFKNSKRTKIFINTLKYQINRLYETQSKLYKQEHNTTDVNEIKKIRKKIHEIRNAIQQKKILIDKMRGTVGIFDLIKYIEEQIEEIEKTPINSPDQIAYVQNMINLALAAGDFSSDEHLFLTRAESKDVHIRQALLDIRERASILNSKLQSVRKRIVANEVKKTIDPNLDLNDIFGATKDRSKLKTEFLNLAKLNDPLTSFIFIKMKEAQFRAHQSALDIFNEIDKLTDKVVPILKKLSPNDTYSLFKQRRRNGLLTGNLVTPYRVEFYEKASQIKKNPILTLEKKVEWWNQNVIVLDPRKLFPTKKTDAYQWNETFTQQEIEDYKKEVISHIGENRFNYLQNKLKERIERFQIQYEIVKDELDSNPNLSAKDKQYFLDRWVSENSPYYQSKILEDPSLIEPNTPTPNFKYTYVMPKRYNIVNNERVETDWYDPQFDTIEKYPELIEFYDYLIETLSALNKMIPSYKREGYTYNTLPTVEKDIFEKFSDNPKSIGIEVFNSIIESLTVSDTGDVDYSEVNPLTGKSEKRTILRAKGISESEIEEIIIRKRLEWLKTLPQSQALNASPTPKQLIDWRLEAIDELSKDKSYDLSKVLKVYAMQVLSYHHKSTIENLLNVAYDEVQRRKEIVENNQGRPMTDSYGDFRIQEGLKNMKDAIDYQLDVFYGKPAHKIQGKTSKKLKTPKEKKQLEEIDNKIKEVEDLFNSNKIGYDEYFRIKSGLEERKEEIEDKVGSTAASKAGDAFLKITQLLYMGWNIVGGVTNRIYGFVANLIEAADGRIYTMKDYRRASMIVSNSIGKNLTFNYWKGRKNIAAKVRGLMDKFDILQHTKNELYKSNKASSISSKYLWLTPYQFNSRIEYINQAETFVAILLHEKVSDYVDGYTGDESLWEAFDENGKWKLEGYPEPDWSKLQLKVENAINRLHGDYSNTQKIKAGVLGRALMQFRTWMPEMINARFADEWEDHIDGIKRKGRYRSMTKAQHMLTFGVFAGVAFGGAGLLVGSAVGLLTGHLFGLNSNMSLIKELLFNLKVLLRKASFSDQFSEVDAANMRANLTELAVLLTSFIIALMVKASLDDDDEEKSRFRNYTYNFLLNQLTRMQTDILFYTNPVEFEKISRNTLPVMGLITDVGKLLDAVGDTIAGEGIYKTGIYKGESKLSRRLGQVTPGVRQYYKIKSNINQLIYPR